MAVNTVLLRRLRRVADRQGLMIRSNRRRDRRALDYRARWSLVERRTGNQVASGLTIEGVAEFLDEPITR